MDVLERSSAFPRHRTGWVALALLFVVCLVPLWWATVDDVLPNSRWGDIGMTVIGVGLPAASFAFARAAAKEGDRSVALAAALVCGLIAVIFGALLALAMVGLAIFGD